MKPSPASILGAGPGAGEDWNELLFASLSALLSAIPDPLQSLLLYETLHTVFVCVASCLDSSEKQILIP